MPGRSFSSNSYRFGYNAGSEKDDEITGVTGSHFTTYFREFDTRILKPWSPDPVFQPWQSPYSYMDGNPIRLNDPKGDKAPSTHTDEHGNVVAIFDDGDLGVYKHERNYDEAKKTVNENHSKDNTSAGGKKMGETWAPLGFAHFETYKATEGKVIIPEPGAYIDFNSSWATIEVGKVLNMDPAALRYGWNARGKAVWDLKYTANQKFKTYGYGSNLFGKFASARDAGNFLAGAVTQRSYLPNSFIDYGFGTYNISNNSVFASCLLVATDAFITSRIPVVGAAFIGLKTTTGENKLSKMGVEAGRNYIKSVTK